LTRGSRADYADREMSQPPRKSGGGSENPIGALYRKMSSWYIAFSIVLFIVILIVGYTIARPLLPHLLRG